MMPRFKFVLCLYVFFLGASAYNIDVSYNTTCGTSPQGLAYGEAWTLTCGYKDFTNADIAKVIWFKDGQHMLTYEQETSAVIGPRQLHVLRHQDDTDGFSVTLSGLLSMDLADWTCSVELTSQTTVNNSFSLTTASDCPDDNMYSVIDSSISLRLICYGRVVQYGDDLQDPWTDTYKTVRKQVDDWLLESCMAASSSHRLCQVVSLTFSQGSIIANFSMNGGYDVTMSSFLEQLTLNGPQHQVEFDVLKLSVDIMEDVPMYTKFSGTINLESIDGEAVVWAAELTNVSSTRYMEVMKQVYHLVMDSCMQVYEDSSCETSDITFTEDSGVLTMWKLIIGTNVSDAQFTDALSAIALSNGFIISVISLTSEAIEGPGPPKPATVNQIGYFHLKSSGGMPVQYSEALSDTMSSEYMELYLVVENLLTLASVNASSHDVMVQNITFSSRDAGILVKYELETNNDFDIQMLMDSIPEVAEELDMDVFIDMITMDPTKSRFIIDLSLTSTSNGDVEWSDDLLVWDSDKYLSLQTDLQEWFDAACKQMSADVDDDCSFMDVTFEHGSVRAVVTYMASKNITTDEFQMALEKLAPSLSIVATVNSVIIEDLMDAMPKTLPFSFRGVVHLTSFDAVSFVKHYDLSSMFPLVDDKAGGVVSTAPVMEIKIYAVEHWLNNSCMPSSESSDLCMVDSLQFKSLDDGSYYILFDVLSATSQNQISYSMRLNDSLSDYSLTAAVKYVARSYTAPSKMAYYYSYEGSMMMYSMDMVQLAWTKTLADQYSEEYKQTLLHLNAWMSYSCNSISEVMCNVSDLVMFDNNTHLTVNFTLLTGKNVTDKILKEVFAMVNLTNDLVGVVTFLNKMPIIHSYHFFEGLIELQPPDDLLPLNADQLMMFSSVAYMNTREIVEKLLMYSCFGLHMHSLCEVEKIHFIVKNGTLLHANITMVTDDKVNNNNFKAAIEEEKDVDGLMATVVDLSYSIIDPPKRKSISGQGILDSLNGTLEFDSTHADQHVLSMLVEDWLLASCREISLGFCDVRSIELSSNKAEVQLGFCIMLAADVNNDVYLDSMVTVASDFNLTFDVTSLTSTEMEHEAPGTRNVLKVSLTLLSHYNNTLVWSEQLKNPMSEEYETLEQGITEWSEASCLAHADTGLCEVKSVKFWQQGVSTVLVNYTMVTGAQVTLEEFNTTLLGTASVYNFEAILYSIEMSKMSSHGVFKKVTIEVKLDLTEVNGQPLVWSNDLFVKTSPAYLALKATVIKWFMKACGQVSSDQCQIADVQFRPGSVQAIVSLQATEDVTQDELDSALHYFEAELGINSTIQSFTASEPADEMPPLASGEQIFQGEAVVMEVLGLQVIWTDDFLDTSSTKYMEVHTTLKNWLLTSCQSSTSGTCETPELSISKHTDMHRLEIDFKIFGPDDLTVSNLEMALGIIGAIEDYGVSFSLGSLQVVDLLTTELPVTETTTMMMTATMEALFNCSDGKEQVKMIHVCDGFLDCEDGSDETMCPTEEPTPPMTIVRGSFYISHIGNQSVVWKDAYRDLNSSEYMGLRYFVEYALNHTCNALSAYPCHVIDIHLSNGSVQVLYSLEAGFDIYPESNDFQDLLLKTGRQMFNWSISFSPGGGSTTTTTTLWPMFTCDNGIQISMSWICDGRNDCTDNSDETGCMTTTPMPDMVPEDVPSEFLYKGSYTILSLGGVDAVWQDDLANPNSTLFRSWVGVNRLLMQDTCHKMKSIMGVRKCVLLDLRFFEGSVEAHYTLLASLDLYPESKYFKRVIEEGATSYNFLVKVDKEVSPSGPAQLQDDTTTTPSLIATAPGQVKRQAEDSTNQEAGNTAESGDGTTAGGGADSITTEDFSDGFGSGSQGTGTISSEEKKSWYEKKHWQVIIIVIIIGLLIGGAMMIIAGYIIKRGAIEADNNRKERARKKVEDKIRRKREQEEEKKKKEAERIAKKEADEEKRALLAAAGVDGGLKSNWISTNDFLSTMAVRGDPTSEDLLNELSADDFFSRPSATEDLDEAVRSSEKLKLPRHMSRTGSFSVEL